MNGEVKSMSWSGKGSVWGRCGVGISSESLHWSRSISV